jgi:hypothetical protein
LQPLVTLVKVSASLTAAVLLNEAGYLPSSPTSSGLAGPRLSTLT